MHWITIASLPFLLVIAWLYTSSVTRSRFPRLKNKRICLLIAHPDDEAMFFAPTILALTHPELGNHVKILCLCSGEVESLKETRKKELVKSGMSLGLRKEDDVFVVESPDFQDGVKTTWDKQKIANLLSSAFAPNISKSKQTKDSEQSTATIDVLVTFDKGGVSAHANHISLYHGAKHFIASLLQSRLGGECPVDLYTLTSVSIFRKYTSFIDGLVTLVITAFSARQKGDHPSPLYFMSGPKDVQTAQFAMTTGHKSQMVWFRYGWIGLSRYLVVNDLKLEKPLKS